GAAHEVPPGSRSAPEAPSGSRSAHQAPPGSRSGHQAPPGRGAAHEAPAALTERELDVLGLVASGRTNREIGAALHISEHTVARHVGNIFTKLGVASRTAASAYAYEHGLVGKPQRK
ncbi:MAG: response regulator transcription factor, partial [Gammaproteobacteria bacterium]|nr:response regulator transcription factor [Gammaproteobacteria bacterium]